MEKIGLINLFLSSSSSPFLSLSSLSGTEDASQVGFEPLLLWCLLTSP